MTVKTIGSDEARVKLRDILDDVYAGQIEVVIERYNKPTAVVVNYSQWQQTSSELARLRRIIEADQDFAAMRAGNYSELLPEVAA